MCSPVHVVLCVSHHFQHAAVLNNKQEITPECLAEINSLQVAHQPCLVSFSLIVTPETLFAPKRRDTHKQEEAGLGFARPGFALGQGTVSAACHGLHHRALVKSFALPTLKGSSKAANTRSAFFKHNLNHQFWFNFQGRWLQCVKQHTQTGNTDSTVT